MIIVWTANPLEESLEWFQGFADRALLRFFSLFFKALKIWFLFVIFLFFFFSFFEKLGKFWEREREREGYSEFLGGWQTTTPFYSNLCNHPGGPSRLSFQIHSLHLLFLLNQNFPSSLAIAFRLDPINDSNSVDLVDVELNYTLFYKWERFILERIAKNGSIKLFPIFFLWYPMIGYIKMLLIKEGLTPARIRLTHQCDPLHPYLLGNLSRGGHN